MSLDNVIEYNPADDYETGQEEQYEDVGEETTEGEYEYEEPYAEDGEGSDSEEYEAYEGNEGYEDSDVERVEEDGNVGYAFDIVNKDGSTEEIVLSQSELAEIVEQSQGMPVDTQFKELSPFINQVKESPFMQSVMRYKAQGYDEGQIIDGLFLLRHPEYANGVPTQQASAQEAEPEYFDTISDEVQYHTRKAVAKEVDELKQMVNQLTGYVQNQNQREVVQQYTTHNDTVFTKAIADYGMNPNDMSPEDLRPVVDAIAQLYPGLDINKAKFSEEQAKMLIRTAYSGRQGNNGKSNGYKQIISASKMPKVMPGRRTSATAPAPMSNPLQSMNGSKTSRSRAVDNFFGW